MNPHRQKLTDRLNAGVSKDLKSEIEYFMNKQHKNNYDIINAFEDAVNFMENNNEDSKLTAEVKLIYIEIGLCEEVDISRVMVTSGRKYWYKLKGKHYDCVEAWDTWINN